MWQPLRPSCLRPTSSLRLTVFPNGQFQHHQSRATLRSRSPCASWAPPLHRGLVRGFFPAPHHHDPNEMLPNFAFWVVVVSHSGPTLEARGCADGLDRRRRAHGQDGEGGSSIGVMASIVECRYSGQDAKSRGEHVVEDVHSMREALMLRPSSDECADSPAQLRKVILPSFFPPPAAEPTAMTGSAAVASNECTI